MVQAADLYTFTYVQLEVDGPFQIVDINDVSVLNFVKAKRLSPSPLIHTYTLSVLNGNKSLTLRIIQKNICVNHQILATLIHF